MELRFTVWQFVRLMVHIEGPPPPNPEQTAVAAAWAEIWRPLDARLADLAERDFEAYSELMMNQDVVVADATPAQCRTAQCAFEEIMKIMDRAIKSLSHDGGRGENTPPDPEHLQSLKFERRELRQLARKLGRLNAP